MWVLRRTSAATPGHAPAPLRIANPRTPSGMGLDDFCTVESFVTRIDNATPAFSPSQEGNHKMLGVVTGGAPGLGDRKREELTIRIFPTGFPQPELLAPGGTLWKTLARTTRRLRLETRTLGTGLDAIQTLREAVRTDLHAVQTSAREVQTLV